jgi:hypothetical protein
LANKSVPLKIGEFANCSVHFEAGGLRSRCAIEHGSDRQKAPDLIAVFRPPQSFA